MLAHLSSIGPTDITFSDEFKVKWAKWKKDDNDIIPGMYCCGFCGVTGFGGQTQSAAGFKTVPVLPDFPAPPYAFTNMDMRSFMEVRGDAPSEGQPGPVTGWRQCHLCTKAKKEGKLCHRMRHNVTVCRRST